MHYVAEGPTIHASMIALMRRRPLVSFFVIAFAWTWAFVIVFLILFPLPDIIVRTTPGDFSAAKNNEVAPVVALAVLALGIAVATRGRLGYKGREPAAITATAFSLQ